MDGGIGCCSFMCVLTRLLSLLPHTHSHAQTHTQTCIHAQNMRAVKPVLQLEQAADAYNDGPKKDDKAGAQACC